jgi:DNA topoisomerase IA
MVLNLNMKYLLIKALVKIKALAKKADMVWLASDEDREGEAILASCRRIKIR